MDKPKPEFFIFKPSLHTNDELWQIIKDFVKLEKDGSIGDCLMRSIAQREASSIHSSYSVLNMERIASKAAFALLKRYFPFQFPSDGRTLPL